MVINNIRTSEAKPFKHKLQPIPFALRQLLEQEVEKRFEVGTFSLADSGACQYASITVLFSFKKDGMLRMCVDYREFNAQTDKNALHLQRINTVWPARRKAKYFALLNLLMGYH